MQCQNAQELFSDYIADLLDRPKSVSLENHLADCSQCKEELADLRGVWSALDTLPSTEPPPFFHENIMSRIAQEAETATVSRGWDWRTLFRPRSLTFAAAAAILLVVLFAGVVPSMITAGLLPFGQHQNAAPLELQTQQASWMANARGGELQLTLRAKPLPGIAPQNQLKVSIKQFGNEIKQVHITSDADTHVKLSLPSIDALTITLTDAKIDTPQSGKTLPLEIK